ncbi:MAG: protein rep, partial [Planctomycetota bacterium]
EAGPSVHPKETPGLHPPPSTYRDQLLTKCPDEYQRTLQIYESLDQANQTHKRWDLEQCRDTAWFAINYETRMVQILSSACRLRWCPLCSTARSAYISYAVKEWLGDTGKPKVLTLTLKHSTESLEQQTTRLYACFRLLRRRKFFKNLCNGGVWFYQIKYIAETDQWHPHLHCLMDATYIPQKLLSTVWKQITGDSDVVDIRAIWRKETACQYVSRYAARPAQLKDLPYGRATQLVSALHGRRLCGTWGTASDISLRPTTKMSFADNYVACKWSTMLQYIKVSTWVQTLYDCWLHHKPLPAHMPLASLDGPCPEIPPDMMPDPPPPDYGGLFE